MQTLNLVLLVEGDIFIRHPLAEYLRQCGFKVLEASNGEEAKIHLNAAGATVDFVLADMTTPGGGFELCEWIRSQELPADVILAGSLEKSIDRAGQICNEGPALAKPYDHKLVLDRIRQGLARRERGKS